jgi:hypothetical protein
MVSRYHFSQRVGRGVQPPHRFGPTDEVAMGHHHARDVDGEVAVAELVEVNQVRVDFAHQVGKVLGGLGQVVWRVVHPLQAEGGGPILEAVEKIHPCGLVGQGNLAEGDQRDPDAARDQSRDQFAGVGPGAGHGIGRDQNVHNASASVPDAAVDAGSGALRWPILVRIM